MIPLSNTYLKNFKKFLYETEETLKTLKDEDEIVPFVEEKISTLLGADYVYLLYKKDKKHYTIPSLGKEYSVDLKKKHLFSEVILKRQPLLLKDVANSLLYDGSLDNLVENDIKDVLLIPVLESKKDLKAPNVLIWAAVSKDSEYSLTQKSTLYLMKFVEALKHYYIHFRSESVKKSKGITLQQCMEQNEAIEALLERNKRYFHSIIHDVRTPMNALLGFLELLSMNEDDGTKKEYLHSALKSGEHIVRLINDALDVAKIESGELPIEKKPFDIHDELEDTVKIFFESASKRKINLCAYIDPLLPKKITSDAYRIKQVLSNLLSNAIKFTPEEGSILVDVIYNESDDTVTVAVEDTGKGIKKEALKTIFAAYRQEDNTTEREYGGTGLGLNISYQIVALLGGRLEVESEVGKGSRFYFTIPALSENKEKRIVDLKPVQKHVRLYRWRGREDLRSMTIIRYLERFKIRFVQEAPDRTLRDIYKNESEGDDIYIIEKNRIFEDDYEYAQLLLDKGKSIVWIEDVFDIFYNYFKGDIRKLTYPIMTKALYEALAYEREEKEKRNTKIEEKSFAGKKVLVVDDNRINLKFMEAILTKMHIKVTLVDDAIGAIERIEKENDYDLMFIDENMPKMFGSEAIAELKKKMREGTIRPLKLISLSGDSHHKEEIFKAGADEVMTKPVHIEELQEVLNRFL
jgi:signal transduction histidine kinase/ActR/RegA family two-component response regulator